DENATNITVTVRRRDGTAGQPPPANITVDTSTLGGTATNGVHFTGANNTLVFPPGEVFQSFTITIVDDFEINANRTNTLALVNIQPSGSAALGNIPTAKLAIINDDSALSFSSATYSRN